MSEQFSLCWDNFHKNMSSGMQSLLENEDLVDVTLAVEGRHLKAHKMVLSVCSPYFRELFQMNPCQHPIVFMKDVSYVALSDLLQFMYQGEVQVAQENLPTFIKTAEALQIKGLTADGPPDSEDAEPHEAEKTDVESSTKRNHNWSPTPSSVTKVRKLSGPASKRQKYTSPVTEVTSTPASASIGSVVKKSEVSASPTSETVLFKMEPESTNQMNTDVLDESQSETFGDDTNIDDAQDDTDDYALMETTDDEPKAGTSADGTSEGQDGKIHHGILTARKKINRTRFVANGFVYHTSVLRTSPPIRYLICSKYGSTGCHSRAILPLNGTIEQLKVTRDHNHPPDDMAEEKFMFINSLKEAAQSSFDGSMRVLFDGILSMYPRLANEVSYDSIRTSMRRWRKEAADKQ